MRSHTYDFDPRSVLRRCIAPLLVVGLFAIFMRAGVLFDFLPHPRPALDMDRTILLHQADASRRRDPARLLLVGDSSCMMNADALQLEQLLNRSCLNLGTLSYLDLDAHRRLLDNFLEVNSNSVTTVVLLLHPEALRRSGPDPVYRDWFNDYLDSRDSRLPSSALGSLQQFLGLHFLNERLWARWMPRPLPGEFGAFYGFTRDLDRYLTKHRGSALDPTRQESSGHPAYALHPNLIEASRQFRAAWPSGIQLWAGITPLPADFAEPDYAARYQEALTQWSAAIGAEPLRELPPEMPPALFATKTHLNARGVAEFTRQLADALKKETDN